MVVLFMEVSYRANSQNSSQNSLTLDINPLQMATAFFYQHEAQAKEQAERRMSQERERRESQSSSHSEEKKRVKRESTSSTKSEEEQLHEFLHEPTLVATGCLPLLRLFNPNLKEKHEDEHHEEHH